MAPNKRIIDDTTSKSKAKLTTRGMTSEPTNNQPLMEGVASISPQKSSVSAHPSKQKDDQLFQMLHEMRSRRKNNNYNQIESGSR